MPRLYLEDDAGNVRIVPLEADEVTIGRAEDNTIVLPERNVSRHHARLRATNGRFFIEDAGARYGLFLNGMRVDGRREVRPGDLIAVGDFKLKILPGEGDAQAADRHDVERTIPERPAMSDADSAVALDGPSVDTSLISLRDMERVARHGWPSDFDGRDEVAQKKSSTRRVLMLVTLIGVAVALMVAYVWVSQPTEVESVAPVPVRVVETRSEPARQPALTETPSPSGAQVEAPSEVPPPPPKEERRTEPERAAIAPTAPTPPPPAQRQAGPTTPPGKGTPKTVAAVDQRPERPTGPVPAKPTPAPQAESEDQVAAIESALQAGRLAEAEGLLTQCRTAACARPWKKLGDRYKASGQPVKAIAAYEKARALTRDAGLKAWLDRTITSIKEGL